MKGEFNKINVDTTDELLDRILDVAAGIKKREDQMRRATRDLRARVAKCIEIGRWDSGIFIVDCDRFVISV